MPTPATYTLEYDMGRVEEAPYWYSLFAKSFKVEYEAANIDEVRVYVVGYDGTEVLVATDDQTVKDKPVGGSTKYAGDWARAYSPYDATDTGTDATGDGISATVCADPELITAIELLPGFQPKTLKIEVDVADDTVSVTVKYPTFYKPTTSPWLYPKTGQTAALLYDGAPGISLGEVSYWNYLTDDFIDNPDPPEVQSFGTHPTALDGACFLRETFAGTDREDGLDTFLAANWLYSEEYAARADFARDVTDPYLQKRLTHSWYALYGGKLFLNLTNSLRETAPMVMWPERARDASLEKTGTPALYTYASGWEYRYTVNAGDAPLHTFDPGGVQWTSALSSKPDGYAVCRHAHAVDNSEDPFDMKREGVKYAEAEPWHGYYAVCPPLTEQEAANPWNWEDRRGRYHRTALDGGVKYYGADWTRPYPGFDRTVQVTSDATDSGPRIFEDPVSGRLYIVFSRG